MGHTDASGVAMTGEHTYSLLDLCSLLVRQCFPEVKLTRMIIFLRFIVEVYGCSIL